MTDFNPTIIDLRSPNLSRGLKISKPVRKGAGGIVTAQNRQAAQIGAGILAKGGSAVDAAIATSFAIGVLEPWMSGLGGVGAMLVRPENGPVTAIDAGARTPRALDPADYPLVEGADGDLFGWPRVAEDRNLMGAKSICIPSLLRGLEAAHRRYGRLSWPELLAPAIRLSDEGPVVDASTMAFVAQDMGRLLRNAASTAIFLPGGLPPTVPASVSGRLNRIRNPALTASLRQIAAEGVAALYEGTIGKALVTDIQALGGYLSADDLATSHAVISPALSQAYRDHILHMAPELNGGITIALALRNLASSPRPQGSVPTPQEVLASAQALAAAWDHRFTCLGDGAERALPSCTTHISVTDRDGLCVSLTQTLLSLFGSGVISPSTGIMLNNGVNWFDPRPDRVNAIGPDRKALANYSPMIMTGPAGDVVAIGGSGGRKILPAVYQALIYLADYGMSLQDAISAPRYDLSNPPTIVADTRLGQEIIATLAAAFPTVLSERMLQPNNFTTLGAIRRAGGVNEGMVEPWHPWADAVPEGEALMPIPDSYTVNDQTLNG